MVTKPYLQIPIVESGDPLLPIPKEQFAYQTPHAYEALGAPYGGASPYFVRKQVLAALTQAQKILQEQWPSWQIFIFDAYRPVAVQEFMVNYAFEEALNQQHLKREQLTSDQEAALWEQVMQIWALPSLDLKTPPPHSTGGAVDVTLYDRDTEQVIDMGSPIDEMSARSHPLYFVQRLQEGDLTEAQKLEAHSAAEHRQVLCDVMCAAGFRRHLGEWWHFCLGDQMWAWLARQAGEVDTIAQYGRVSP